MRKPSILIVEDEKNTRDGLARALRKNYTIHIAEKGSVALEILAEHPIDVVLSDIRMPGMDGLALLRRILASEHTPTVILLTAYGSVELAVEAMKQGAYDFLTKPVNLDQLDVVLQRATEAQSLKKENRTLKKQLDERFGIQSMVGKSTAMEQLFETIKLVAPRRTTVLIQGESGTGKELAARAIHDLSPRHSNPFIPVHCAALTPSLLESELFGHEKGAFTGANEQRKGRFELADGGSLFLDEIGEIDLSTQVKILRVLEERTFERVGGTKTLDVDVRLIAATNRNLKDMVAKGRFREDLYFRLNVVQLTLPPLRNRKGDVPLLLDHFIRQIAQDNDLPAKNLTPDALQVLQQYTWPGNIRELRNVVERMLVLSANETLGRRDIPDEILDQSPELSGSLPTSGSLEDMEKEMIIRALEKHQGNRTKAAESLGISRRTLHRKLNEYDLHEKK